jgi:hypothetical protein
MVMNRLQKGLINFRIALRASRLNCKKKLMGTHNFFSSSNRDFYSENNKYHNVSVFTYQKLKKK